MSAVAAVPAATSGPAFTSEQRAAIAARDGSRLLGANAGSGKTAVMVERFVEAVLADGVPVGEILAITFTEKAAAELRERLRRRFAERGEPEHAHAADTAWVGTIHGFCARVLRQRSLAAGLDPRFTVLEEATAGRLVDAAFDEALDAWVAAEGQAALDVAAAYGAGLRGAIVATHAALRSRGQTRPALPAVSAAPSPDPAVLRTALATTREAVAAMKDGRRVAQGLAALDACEAALARGGVPLPNALGAAALPGGRPLDTEPCDAYRAALETFRQACADHHARAALPLLDALLRRFDTAYRAARSARAAVDFADLELHVRDLLRADHMLRRRLAERFRLIMVDEFQDTNRVQLEILEHLERDNLFAVGDEFQAIYGFRHADVTIFRERRGALGPGRTPRLTANFRSQEELLDVVNGAFAPLFGPAFAPLVAGAARRSAAHADGDDLLRLFDPDAAVAAGEPPVELLVTDATAWEDARAAEARAVATRLRAEIDAGRPPKDIVVLVRATASLRPLEEALEVAGVPTYVVGGRGYWSREQVRDALAWLAVLSNPLDEPALYTVLASPFCGVGADALVLLAAAGRERDGGPAAALHALAAEDGDASWAAPLDAAERARLTRFARVLAAERAVAERLPLDARIERGVLATDYDLAVLARRGGERRLANLRKLLRLAREHENAEGPDVRGFLAFAAAQDLAEAREGDAPLEGEGLDAIRLMTIHRAKGLEFPVVCVADLGRAGNRNRPVLLTDGAARVGLRLCALGGGRAVPALDYDALVAEQDRAEDDEERRLLYVALTRAQERLILSGAVDPERPPAPRPGGPPLAWLLEALLDAPAAALAAGDADHARTWDGRPARLRVRLVRPGAPAAEAPPARPRLAAPGTALPTEPKAAPVPAAARPSARRLSYTALQSYARCPYRFYAERVLRLPRDPAPPPLDVGAEAAGAAPAEPTAATPPAEDGLTLDPRTRGSLVHLVLERLDLEAGTPPAAETVRAIAAELEVAPTEADVADVLELVGGFLQSPVATELAAARALRREASFAFTLEPDGGGPLVTGFVDAIATGGDGSTLVVDYKSDRLEGADPVAVTERDYGIQRVVYALAALRGGAPRVEVAHVYLERPDVPATVTYSAGDVAALQEKLVTVASGVLDERWPVTDRPHRGLCGDCPARRRLCSHPETVTLREAPDPPVPAPSGA